MSQDRMNAVLDADSVYAANARALFQRYHQKKVSLAAYNHIQGWLQAAALRRHERAMTRMDTVIKAALSHRRAA